MHLLAHRSPPEFLGQVVVLAVTRAVHRDVGPFRRRRPIALLLHLFRDAHACVGGSLDFVVR